MSTASTTPEFLAAGTDLMERRRTGVSQGVVTPLQRSAESAAARWAADGSAVVGASVTIAALASDPKIAAAYPGIAAAAGGLATPQIRNVATIGGNIAQRSRCWYYRNPHYACLKKGGATCPARDGNHLYGVIFDTGPCVAPHPSTMGAALLAYDAIVTTSARGRAPIADIFGDGRDGSRDNTLTEGEIITTIELPVPVAGERAVYNRCVSRTYAEWPLVEVVLRMVRDGDRVTFARLAVGGVAPVPLRLAAVEQAIVGGKMDAGAIAAAAQYAASAARPLPQTGYKVTLLEALVRDLLGRLT